MSYSKQTWDTTSYVNPTRMNHIEDGIDNALPKDSGGTVKGSVTIDSENGTTSSVGYSNFVIGNNKGRNVDKNTSGHLYIFSDSQYSAHIKADSNFTTDRNFNLPDKSGTIALLSDSFPASQVSISNGSTLTTLDEMLKFPFGNIGQTELGRFDVTYNNITYEIAGIKVYVNSKTRYTIFGSILSGSNSGGKFAIYNSWQNTFILINPGKVPSVNKYSVTLSSSTNVDTITDSSINGSVTVIGMSVNGVSAGTSMMSHFTEIKYVSSNKLQITRDSNASYAGTELTLLCVNSDTL